MAYLLEPPPGRSIRFGLSEDEKTIRELREQVLVLEQQLDWFKRQLFGRKGEQFEHPELFGETGPEKDIPSGGADVPAEGEKANATTGVRSRRRRPVRAGRLPDDLPRVTEVVTPPEVLADPGKWKLLGEDERKWLEKEPGHFYLRVKVYQTYVPADGSPTGKAVTSPAPPTIIEGGFWGEGLLAEVLCNRYLYHLPYARQESLYKTRFGIELSRKTMSDGAGKAADQLCILTRLMKEEMLGCGYIQADETEVRYLDRDAPGGSSRGRFWVYKGANGDVLFDWQLTRGHHHFTDWIGGDFEGVIGSDGYEAYPNYCRVQTLRGKTVERAACHAHIRRKYEGISSLTGSKRYILISLRRRVIITNCSSIVSSANREVDSLSFWQMIPSLATVSGQRSIFGLEEPYHPEPNTQYPIPGSYRLPCRGPARRRVVAVQRDAEP